MVYDFFVSMKKSKRKTKTIAVIIIALLLVNGGIFAFVMQGQMNDAPAASEGDPLMTGRHIAAGVEEVEDAVSAAVSDAEKLAAEADAKARTADAKKAADHVIPHRDSSGSDLEHSFRAYDEALEAGATCLEQDIVVSKDGTLFVSHDNSARRMTGVDRNFYDMTDAEVDGLRTHAGEKVLRLSEVFDRYGDSVSYVIELKDQQKNMTRSFVDLVNQYGNEGRIIVQCFNIGTLKDLEEAFPDMPKMYLCKAESELEKGYQADYVDIIAPKDSMMTEANVKRAHDQGKQFCSWPINSEEWIKKAIDIGVDSYFTKDVKLALSIEEEYGNEKRKQ